MQQRIIALKQMFMSKGMGGEEALRAAYKMLGYNVANQASILSFMDVFMFIGVMFLACIPFVLMVRAKKTKEKVDLSEAMH